MPTEISGVCSTGIYTICMSNEGEKPMSETPRQKALRALNEAPGSPERAGFLSDVMQDPTGRKAHEVLNDFYHMNSLTPDEIAALKMSIIRAGNAQTAAIIFGGMYDIFSPEERERLIDIVSKGGDKAAASNLLRSGRPLSNEQKATLQSIAQQ